MNLDGYPGQGADIVAPCCAAVVAAAAAAVHHSVLLAMDVMLLNPQRMKMC